MKISQAFVAPLLSALCISAAAGEHVSANTNLRSPVQDENVARQLYSWGWFSSLIAGPLMCPPNEKKCPAEYRDVCGHDCVDEDSYYFTSAVREETSDVSAEDSSNSSPEGDGESPYYVSESYAVESSSDNRNTFDSGSSASYSEKGSYNTESTSQSLSAASIIGWFAIFGAVAVGLVVYKMMRDAPTGASIDLSERLPEADYEETELAERRSSTRGADV